MLVSLQDFLVSDQFTAFERDNPDIPKVTMGGGNWAAIAATVLQVLWPYLLDWLQKQQPVPKTLIP